MAREKDGTGFSTKGGLVFKAHRLLYHSTLGLRVIKKKKEGSNRLLDKWLADPHAVAHNVVLQRESSLLTTYWSESTLSS